MFDRSSQQSDTTGLEEAIYKALRQLDDHDANSDDYKKIVDQLGKLYALQKMVEDFNLRNTEMISQQTLAEMDAQQKLAEAETRVRLAEEETRARLAEAETRAHLAEAEVRLKDIQGAEMLKNLDKKFWQRLSPDTLALVAGNLAGIGLVLGYERGHVMVTKAWNYLLKTR